MHISLQTSASLHLRYLLGLCTEVPAIHAVLNSRAVFAHHFSSSTFLLLYVLSTISASGPVLFRAVARVGMTHAGWILKSIQTGLLETFYRLRCEYVKSGFFCKSYAYYFTAKPVRAPKEGEIYAAQPSTHMKCKPIRSVTSVCSLSAVLCSRSLVPNWVITEFGLRSLSMG